MIARHQKLRSFKLLTCYRRMYTHVFTCVATQEKDAKLLIMMTLLNYFFTGSHGYASHYSIRKKKKTGGERKHNRPKKKKKPAESGIKNILTFHRDYGN